jgi:anti-sigma B factor antagonist
MQLNITKSTHGDWVILAAEGEIDIATAPELDQAVETVISEGATAIAVDLSPAGFMDSTGLRSLILAQRKVQAVGGSMAVVSGSGPIRRLLEVAGVVEALSVVPTRDSLPTP